MPGIFSHGSTLGYNTSGAPSVYTQIANLRSFPFPDVETDDLDASHLLSPEKFREWVAGWSDGGTMEAEFIFTGAQYAALIAIIRTKRGWKIQLPPDEEEGETTGASVTFEGYSKWPKGVVNHEELIIATVEIKVSGPPEFVEGS